MKPLNEDLVFGPVPSRRLGQSLGVNNIPPKICTYSCVYCQIGRTQKKQTARQAFYPPEEIVNQAQKRIARLRSLGQRIDHVSFVPDGEPTLDIRIGEIIELLTPSGIDIAVITNASLLWQAEVRDAISRADWVSIKVDAASPEQWHKINRPHKDLDLATIQAGCKEFKKQFRGFLATETMLIRGLNDDEQEIRRIADLISEINPDRSYLSVPTRPPAESWVEPASEASLTMAHHIFASRGLPVEYLIEYEGTSFGYTGDVEKDILSAASVHPMREEAVRQLLRKAGAPSSTLENLVSRGDLIRIDYQGHTFYLRSLPHVR